MPKIWIFVSSEQRTMKDVCPSFLVFFLICLFSSSQTAKAQAFDADESISKLLPVTPEMEAVVAKTMQGCAPQEGNVVGEINNNGAYTLTGDLFRNGRVYAIIDVVGAVVLCEWQKPVWKTVSVINVETEWNWPSGYRDPDGRSPDNQPQPFWMLDFQNRSLLVIASQVEKEGQYYYVILLDSKGEKILSMNSSFGLRPEVKDHYLLTGDSSRVKSEWEATYFSQIQNNAFVVMKSWEDSQPWHAEDREGQPDDSSNYASSDGKGYIILPDNSGSKLAADYVIFRSDPTQKGSSHREAHGEPSAAIYFTPNKDLYPNGDETLAYLFEKLTGLPMELYPDYERMGMKGKPEPKWKIKVTGSDEVLVKLLSSNSTQ